jgi:transcriptional regulator with XRE-family HTH domain
MQLGRAIKFFRIMRNYTLPTLAERCGKSASYLSLVERDKRDPSMSTVSEIAAALAIPLPLLMYMAETPEFLSAQYPNFDPLWQAMALASLQAGGKTL